MSQICNKSKYPDKTTVLTKINSLIKTRRWNRKDKSCRPYYCVGCNAWHMSSLKEYEPIVQTTNISVTYVDRWSKIFKNT